MKIPALIRSYVWYNMPVWYDMNTFFIQHIYHMSIKFIFVISTRSAIFSIVNRRSPSEHVMIYQIRVQFQSGAPITNTNFN